MKLAFTLGLCFGFDEISSANIGYRHGLP